MGAGRVLRVMLDIVDAMELSDLVDAIGTGAARRGVSPREFVSSNGEIGLEMLGNPRSWGVAFRLMILCCCVSGAVLSAFIASLLLPLPPLLPLPRFVGLFDFGLETKSRGVSSPTTATVELGDGIRLNENGRPTSLSSQTDAIIGFPSLP